MLSPLRVTTGPRQHIPQFWSGRGACVGAGAEKLPNAGSVDKGFFFYCQDTGGSYADKLPRIICITNIHKTSPHKRNLTRNWRSCLSMNK